MKKILVLALAMATAYSVVGCEDGAESLVGVYENVSFAETTYQLNENGSYDKTAPNEKGTYEAKRGGFVLTEQGKSNSDEEFEKKDQYYYRTNLICCFEEDNEYGMAPSFDENGRTNQSFYEYYERITDEKHKCISLTLNEDGTFVLSESVVKVYEGNRVGDPVVHKGEYKLDDYVLNLNYDGMNHPFLYLNNKIYFDVLEKVSE